MSVKMSNISSDYMEPFSKGIHGLQVLSAVDSQQLFGQPAYETFTL